MNQQVQLTVEDYEFLNGMLLNTIGYSEIPPRQKRNDFIRLDLQLPRKIKGSEKGYRYSNNQYTAKVWPTYVPKEEKFRDVGEDAGWVIVTQGDELAYSAKPINRLTREGFIMNILRYAWVTKWKIDNIPLCPCCNAQMVIYRKQGTRCYMYACMEVDSHPDKKWRFRDWDYGLKEKAKAFVQIRRDATALYKEKMKALGKEPVPAATKRKKWEPRNKENIIPNRFK